jgi:hypothetical protein
MENLFRVRKSESPRFSFMINSASPSEEAGVR